MPTPTGQPQAKALTVYLTRKKRRRVGKVSVGLWVATAVAVAAVSWYSGWFAGCSQTPIAASIVPLLFGLLTAFLLVKVSWPRALAAPLIVVAFIVGYDLGENVGDPMTVEQVLAHENIDVSDRIYDELTLLDAALRKAEFDSVTHDAILLGVGARIAQNLDISLESQLQQIKHFRKELESL